MKKSLVVLLVFLLIFSLGLSQAFAVEPDEVTGSEVEELTEDNVLTPDSPFYFFKRFVESVRLWLTFDQEKRVELLEELAEERLKELEALHARYGEGELTEQELDVLEQALDDLIVHVEILVVSLDEPVEPDEEEPNGDDELYVEGDGEEEEFGDKYLWRIAHLEAIKERAPAAAHFGLERAIANAWRQREKAIEKGRIPPDEEEAENDEEPELTIEITEDGTEEEPTEEELEAAANEEEPEADENGDDPELDKYQQRIEHLQAIKDRAPEGAKKGLERAMQNAERQRGKAIDKGRISQ